MILEGVVAILGIGGVGVLALRIREHVRLAKIADQRLVWDTLRKRTRTGYGITFQALLRQLHTDHPKRAREITIQWLAEIRDTLEEQQRIRCYKSLGILYFVAVNHEDEVGSGVATTPDPPQAA